LEKQGESVGLRIATEALHPVLEESLDTKGIGDAPPWLKTDLKAESRGDPVKKAVEGRDIKPMFVQHQFAQRRPRIVLGELG
jgi:hypothetical protein